MIQSPYTVRLLHEEKVRDLVKHAPHSQRINELGKAASNGYEEGLLPGFRQWLSSRLNHNRPTEVVTEVKRATAH
jgi:hypothetical protein